MTTTTETIEFPRGNVCAGCRKPLPADHQTALFRYGNFHTSYATCPTPECVQAGQDDIVAYAKLHRCAGCFGHIPDGRIGQVTVTSRGHLRTVNSHESDQCRQAAHTNTVNDLTWVRRPATSDL